jgi:hypothetical protein
MKTVRWHEWTLLAALMLLMAMMWVRPVGAEDDCAEPTLMVERLPVLGLVCIGEGHGRWWQ